MSAIIGLSDAEVRAIADAASSLRKLSMLTGWSNHDEVAEVLEQILTRLSRMWGASNEVRKGEHLLQMLQEILPPEEPSDERA